MSTKRKSGPSEAELRLQRMLESARPASERQAERGERPGDGGLASTLGGDSVPAAPPIVAPTVAPHVPPAVTGDVTGNTASPVTSHVTGDVAAHSADTSASAGRVAGVSPAGAHTLPSGHLDAAGVAAPASLGKPQQQFTARVRGRWTREQKAFINRLGKDQRATAGEILRHVAAWFLERRSYLASTPRSTTPSGQTLIKRETGLLIFDFLTTPQQATQIKEASVGLGEAAWLRQAVDAYRDQGPLAGTD